MPALVLTRLVAEAALGWKWVGAIGALTGASTTYGHPVFGVIGLLANVAAILVLPGGRGDNLNMRAAFLEVLTDALGSVAVLIIPRTLRLLRGATDVLLESVPRVIELDDVRRLLLCEEHVVDVPDLHITQIATGLSVLTAHVVVEAGCSSDDHAREITRALQCCAAEHFPVAIDYATFPLDAFGLARREPH